MNYVAKMMNIDLIELKSEMTRVAKFYDMEDLDLDEQLFLFVLAKVRDLNSDELNMYRIGTKVKVVYTQGTTELEYDDNFYENLFGYFDDVKLTYKIK